MFFYTIKRGDSVYQIARKFDISPEKIIQDNNIADARKLTIGENLFIDINELNYKIQQNDNLGLISAEFNVPIDSIIMANPKIDSNNLIVGEYLIIPFPNIEKRTIEVNGYVLPNVTNEVLFEILPNLTYISIFSYNILENGELTGIDEQRIINLAYQNNVAPLMVITNFVEGGGFDSDLASIVLNDEQIQNILISNILEIMREKGYWGVNIDFEYILPEDRGAYNNFLRNITNTMHSNGFIVSTAIAPKINDEQKGLLYEAHDYKAHGEIVDRVIIMTYEWGYTFGPPLPVSPLTNVSEVLEYATSVIPSDKILMGMPNYAYDWKLPFVQGESVAQAMSLNQAINLARRVGAEIKFDDTNKTPYFTYYNNGAEHIVWFDDVKSIFYKLNLVNEFDLAGVSCWTLNTFFKPNWIILNRLFNIEKLV